MVGGLVTIAPLLLGTPVIASRQWSTGLAPRAGGGWDFVCQSYNYPLDVPTEWVVTNLETGATTITEGPNTVASNSNFQVPSANTAITDNNQIRASNGRIFFPCFGTRVAYFDPADRGIHQVTPIVDPSGNTNAIIFNLVFNHDGSKLYGSMQVAVGQSPMVLELDPVTLATSVIGYVGSGESAQVTYGYYLAVDEGAPYVYVAVGQDPWELWAINTSTGVATELSDGLGTITAINFNLRPQGWEASLTIGGVANRYWVADGQKFPGAPVHNPSDFTARNVTPYVNALVSPPQIDWTPGIGRVLWRPAGSSGAWTTVDYDVTYTAPIPIESLQPLASGAVLGNAEQYNGFFSVGSGVAWFGAWKAGLSGPATLEDASKVYMCGYPNGAIYQYDPATAWSGASNPTLLGSFGSDLMKHPYFLLKGGNGRLYCLGRRERDATGAGIGYYAGGSVTGTAASPLDAYTPRGLAITSNRVVVSGEVDSGTAKLLCFDMDLALQEQRTVKTGLANTGLLFPSEHPDIVVGLTNDKPTFVYRYNVATGTLLGNAMIGLPVGAATQRASDKSIWVMLGNLLSRIDIATLAIKVAGTIAGVTLMAWQGAALYIAKSAELYRLLDGDGAASHGLRVGVSVGL